jgi:hypothetical protein
MKNAKQAEKGTLFEIAWPKGWEQTQGWPTPASGPEWAELDRRLRETSGASAAPYS